MDLKHFSHDHPLVFIQDWSRASEEEKENEEEEEEEEEDDDDDDDDDNSSSDYDYDDDDDDDDDDDEEEEEEEEGGGRGRCSACGEGVEGPCYYCSDCKFYLHKTCAELELSPVIKHPFHPPHSLILLPKPPYNPGTYQCNLCRGTFSGLVYHCASCQFHLDINCASIAGDFDKLQHPSHEHPFIFIETQDRIIKADCLICLEKISSDQFYKCLDCEKVYLHKKCTDLAIEISHPIHPSHPLILKLESASYRRCNLCRRFLWKNYYHCASCDFNLDIKCASVGGKFGKLKHPSHEHPLIFVEAHDRFIRAKCFGCAEKIYSDPFYKCLDCIKVYLHKKCADLPLEIANLRHRRHLLLLQKLPIHSKTCSCYLCKKKPLKGFVYSCDACEFVLTLEDVFSLPKKITSKYHKHPWTPLSRQMPFICDFCGIDGDIIPYLCTTCNFIVHKDCILLPSAITIMRHNHRLSHSYSPKIFKFEECKCRICYKEVNTGYGSYCCPTSNCNYIAHVKCATHSSIWDPNHEYEWSEAESMNWITSVVKKEMLNEDEIATEIKHAFHDHNLILTFSGKVRENGNCDGCMRPISTPFYGCKECEFFLHKSCAELAQEKRHPSHKHLLALLKSEVVGFCGACLRLHSGFRYKCKTQSCDFEIDIQCSLLPDSFRHPSHEHPLFLHNNCEGNCSGCRKEIVTSFAYKCVEGCDEFMLEFNCLTLPQIARYKYDKHPFSLTYNAGSDPDQFYCDICEEERDPNKWFYSCVDCDTSAHLKCILGELPFIKFRKTLLPSDHPHLVTTVKNIWNCRPCNVCKKLCYGQALQCTECNFNIHWECLDGFQEAVWELVEKITGKRPSRLS